MENIVYRAVDWVLAFIEYAILARVIISWLPVSRDNRFIRILYQLTDPILTPVRNIIERSAIGKNAMFDFSPIVAFLLIGVLRNILVRVLFR